MNNLYINIYRCRTGGVGSRNSITKRNWDSVVSLARQTVARARACAVFDAGYMMYVYDVCVYVYEYVYDVCVYVYEYVCIMMYVYMCI